MRSLAESSTDILLWKIPLNSHFADAVDADVESILSSSEVERLPSCLHRSPTLRPSYSSMRQRRGRALRSRYLAPDQPCRVVPRLWPLHSDRLAHCLRRTLAASSKSACRSLPGEPY